MPAKKRDCCKNLIDALNAAMDTMGDTGQAHRHAKHIMSASHQKAKYRRLELPMTEVPVFSANPEVYQEADQKAKLFMRHNFQFQAIVKDLQDDKNDHGTHSSKHARASGPHPALKPRQS